MPAVPECVSAFRKNCSSTGALVGWVMLTQSVTAPISSETSRSVELKPTVRSMGEKLELLVIHVFLTHGCKLALTVIVNDFH